MTFNDLIVEAGLTEETDDETKNNGTDDKAPVPHVIITYQRYAEEHEYDAVTRCTTTQQ